MCRTEFHAGPLEASSPKPRIKPGRILGDQSGLIRQGPLGPHCNYCGRKANSVFSLNSSDLTEYRHSTPRLGRRPVSRINRASPGDSDPSTRTIKSPGTNFSILRDATNVAVNASFTRNLVIIISLLLLGIRPVRKLPNQSVAFGSSSKTSWFCRSIRCPACLEHYAIYHEDHKRRFEAIFLFGRKPS